MIFSVAFAYLEAEQDGNFNWCLDNLRSLMCYWHISSVIITDRDISCMNVTEKIFSTSRHSYVDGL